MDKERYLEIRSQFAFNRKLTFLLAHIAMDVAIIFVIGLVSSFAHPAMTIPLLATLMFRNFGLLHDASHGAVHISRKINDLIGFWASLFCLLPFEPWKKNHLEHHFWTGNVEKDPVSALRIELPKASPRFISLLNMTWKIWVPLLGTLQNVLFWRLSLRQWRNKRDLKTGVSLLLPLIAWTALVVFLPLEFVSQALLPALIFYFLMNEIVNMPHHLQLPILRGSERHAVWNQHAVARTCRYPRWFARNFVLNFNFHAEHHMFPEAPWYFLDEIHEIIAAELGDCLLVDQSFHWTLENRSVPFIDVITREQSQKAAAA